MKVSTLPILAFVVLLAFFGSYAMSADIDVIVNAHNPLTSISAEELNAFFTKKDRTWNNGDAVRFFDYRDEHANRQLFLKKHVHKTSREIELYWIGEKIYTGNIAPIQVTSDSMMVAMVSRFKGGIGYVSSQYKFPNTVKRIQIIKSAEKKD